MNRRRRTHITIAVIWAALMVPATLLWPESVYFVIVSSVWANIYAAVAAGEAADNALTDEDKAWILEALKEHRQ